MLKIKPHSVKTEKGDIVELLTAVECKGIVGNDGRHYLLDLLRMTPPDLNYLPGKLILVLLKYARILTRILNYSRLRIKQ
jgi:protein TIF31